MNKISKLFFIISILACYQSYSQKYEIVNHTDQALWVKVYSGMGEQWMSAIPTGISGGIAAVGMKDCLSNITKQLQPKGVLKIDVPCCMSDIRVSRTDKFSSDLTSKTGTVCATDNANIHQSDANTFYIDTSSTPTEYEKRQMITVASTSDSKNMDSQSYAGKVEIKFIENKPASKVGATKITKLKTDEDNIKKSDPSGFGQLHKLINNNKFFKTINADTLESAEDLITSGLLESRTKKFETPLMIAVKNGSRDWVAFLLRHHADPTLMNDNNQNSLHLSALSNDLYIVQAIIEAAKLKGLSKNKLQEFVYQTDKSGNTVFDSISDMSLLAMLLSDRNKTGGIKVKFSDINKKSENSGDTKLISAIKAKQFELARQLLDMKADSTIRNNNDNDALITLLPNFDKSNKAYNLLELLLRDANLNEERNNRTRLTEAINLRSPELISKLIDAGADVNMQSKKPKIFSRDGKNITVQEGATPLLFALLLGDINLIDLLLKKGAKKDAKFKVVLDNVVSEKTYEDLLKDNEPLKVNTALKNDIEKLLGLKKSE